MQKINLTCNRQTTWTWEFSKTVDFGACECTSKLVVVLCGSKQSKLLMVGQMCRNVCCFVFYLQGTALASQVIALFGNSCLLLCFWGYTKEQLGVADFLLTGWTQTIQDKMPQPFPTTRQKVPAPSSVQEQKEQAEHIPKYQQFLHFLLRKYRLYASKETQATLIWHVKRAPAASKSQMHLSLS